MLPYIREPAKRAQIEYRAGWNIVLRRVMCLKPLDAIGINHLRRNKKTKQERVRCILTVYKDTVYKNYILSLRTSDDKLVETEEGCMHTDFNCSKADYSTLTAHTKENEILVPQEYIEHVLFAKADNWPEDQMEGRIAEERDFFNEQVV